MTGRVISVGELKENWLSRLRLENVCDETGVSALITAPSVRKPGLRMTERPMKLDPGCVHILGETECAYISRLSEQQREELADEFTRQAVPCLIVSNGIEADGKFKSLMKRRSVALLKSAMSSENLMSVLSELLEWKLAPFTTFHGTLVVVHGMGALITGPSGVGKSECALDLVVRGWKFVADDVVEIKKVGAHLLGSAPETVKCLMEIRGVGIVNIGDLFGGTSVMESHSVDMIINIELWRDGREYDRLGFEDRTQKILEAELPLVSIPVRPGRNTATLAEVAVRNQILKTRGISPLSSLPESVAGPKTVPKP